MPHLAASRKPLAVAIVAFYALALLASLGYLALSYLPFEGEASLASSGRRERGKAPFSRPSDETVLGDDFPIWADWGSGVALRAPEEAASVRAFILSDFSDKAAPAFLESFSFADGELRLRFSKAPDEGSYPERDAAKGAGFPDAWSFEGAAENAGPDPSGQGAPPGARKPEPPEPIGWSRTYSLEALLAGVIADLDYGTYVRLAAPFEPTVEKRWEVLANASAAGNYALAEPLCADLSGGPTLRFPQLINYAIYHGRLYLLAAERRTERELEAILLFGAIYDEPEVLKADGMARLRLNGRDREKADAALGYAAYEGSVRFIKALLARGTSLKAYEMPLEWDGSDSFRFDEGPHTLFHLANDHATKVILLRRGLRPAREDLDEAFAYALIDTELPIGLVRFYRLFGARFEPDRYRDEGSTWLHHIARDMDSNPEGAWSRIRYLASLGYRLGLVDREGRRFWEVAPEAYRAELEAFARERGKG